MRNHGPLKLEFRSQLGSHMLQHIQEKQAQGLKYEVGIHALKRLDRFLLHLDFPKQELPKEIVEQWSARRDHEQPGTQRLRVHLLRQFACYLQRQDIPVYIPEFRTLPIHRPRFTAHIFRRQEIQAILLAVDMLEHDPRSPLRTVIMPEVIRLLIGCGMRISEVLNLKVADVDHGTCVLKVREGKFGKDRFIPLSPDLAKRLGDYANRLGIRPQSGPFFPAPDGGQYSVVSIYATFRELLRKCHISHGGRGKGPRLHDLRHCFAVYNLERWYRQGEDLNAKLPLLATYLGHQSLVGTQRYLQLTAEIFPDICARLEKHMGHLIPGVSSSLEAVEERYEVHQ